MGGGGSYWGEEDENPIARMGDSILDNLNLGTRINLLGEVLDRMGRGVGDDGIARLLCNCAIFSIG